MNSKLYLAVHQLYQQRCKIYQISQIQMKQRSSTEIWPSDYFFAVYPVSFTFERDYKTPFHLYFQKGLQMISKHQTPIAEVKKGQTVKFTQPQQIHHFRVQSEKNLDYQWSLYVIKMDMHGDNEQFIEAQKITLKDSWAAYKSKKVSLFQQNIQFNSIRCRLNYLVIIANNSGEVSEMAQKYFADTKIPVSTSEEKNINSVQALQSENKLLKNQANNMVQNSQNKVQSQQVKIEVIVQPPLEENIEKSQKVNISEIELKSCEGKQLNLSPESRQNKIGEHLLSPKEENHKLTISQLDLGNQIEDKVNNKQNILNQNAIPEIKQATLQTESKKITLTNSHLVNENNQKPAQVQLSVNKQKTSIWVFICLAIMILGGVMWAISKTEPSNSKQPKNSKGKKVKSNKQAVNKQKKCKK